MNKMTAISFVCTDTDIRVIKKAGRNIGEVLILTAEILAIRNVLY